MSRIAAASRLLEIGRARDALELLLRELVDDPDSVSARIELVWVHVALKDKKAAHRTADEALELDPDNPRAMYAKANAHGSFGEYRKGLDWLERALGCAPYYGSFHSYRGVLLLKLNRLDEALESVERALELAPNDAYSIDVRIEVLRALQREAEALAATQAALALYPERASFLQHLGELTLHSKDAATADGLFKAVLRQDPSRVDAKSGLVDALRAKSKLYRWLTAFQAWSDRKALIVKQRRVRIALFSYFVLAFSAAVLGSKTYWAWVVLIPIVIAVPVVLVWFALYAATQFIVPWFLVPVLFDPTGKHALKESIADKWLRGAYPKAATSAYVLFVACAGYWHWLRMLVVIPLTFQLARTCRPGRIRRVLYVLAASSVVLVAFGLAPHWGAREFIDTMMWWGLAGVLLVVSVILAIVEKKRASKAARHADSTRTG